MDLTYLDRKELTAFFINIYNALVVHGMVLFGPAESTLKRCASVFHKTAREAQRPQVRRLLHMSNVLTQQQTHVVGARLVSGPAQYSLARSSVV